MSNRRSPPLCTFKPERKRRAPPAKGGTGVFELRDSWVPDLGNQMARVHKPKPR